MNELAQTPRNAPGLKPPVLERGPKSAKRALHRPARVSQVSTSIVPPAEFRNACDSFGVWVANLARHESFRMIRCPEGAGVCIHLERLSVERFLEPKAVEHFAKCLRDGRNAIALMRRTFPAFMGANASDEKLLKTFSDSTMLAFTVEKPEGYQKSQLVVTHEGTTRLVLGSWEHWRDTTVPKAPAKAS